MFDRFQEFFRNPALLLSIPAALLAIMLHEVSHGLTAYWMGDPTAKKMGRLTLNPIPHIDIFGLICLVVMHFGWAKPVPVDMRYFKNPRRGFALVALAGPVSNFLQALVGFLLFYSACLLTPMLWGSDPLTVLYGLLSEPTIDFFRQYPVMLLHFFLSYYILMNVGLGVFNLFPIPPLDGSKIVGIVIPDRYYYRILRYERYGMILLVVLLFTGVLDKPLQFLLTNALQGIGWLAGLPFGGAFGS